MQFSCRNPTALRVSTTQFVVEGLAQSGVGVIAALVVIGAVVYAVTTRETQNITVLWASLLFAPFGALTRFGLTKRVGSIRGTFAANMLGCLVAAVAHRMSEKELLVDVVAGDIIVAVGTGFAGALSTVSSFFSELVSIEDTPTSYSYGILTAVCAQVIVTIVNVI